MRYKQLDYPLNNYIIGENGDVYRILKDGLKVRKLKHTISVTGHKTILLTLSTGEQYKYIISHLVATAFLNNTNGYRFVDYIDGDKDNVSVSNLIWVKRPSTSNYSSSKQRKPVRCVETGEVFPSGYAAAAHLNVSCTRIYQSLDRHDVTVKGYHFIHESL